MSWEEQSSSNVIDLKKKRPGEFVEGYYTGSRKVTTKIGEQVIWLFSGEEDTFGVYGFTNLNKYMESAEKDKLYKLIYKGTERVNTKYGMRDVHQVSVLKWNGEKPVKSDKSKEPKAWDEEDDLKF